MYKPTHVCISTHTLSMHSSVIKLQLWKQMSRSYKFRCLLQGISMKDFWGWLGKSKIYEARSGKAGWNPAGHGRNYCP